MDKSYARVTALSKPTSYAPSSARPVSASRTTRSLQENTYHYVGAGHRRRPKRCINVGSYFSKFGIDKIKINLQCPIAALALVPESSRGQWILAGPSYSNFRETCNCTVSAIKGNTPQ